MKLPRIMEELTELMNLENSISLRFEKIGKSAKNG